MVGGGFGPNILSLLVLIEIRIRLKLGCDNDPKIKYKSNIRNDGNTHYWNNDKPYECGLETLDGG